MRDTAPAAVPPPPAAAAAPVVVFAERAAFETAVPISLSYLLCFIFPKKEKKNENRRCEGDVWRKRGRMWWWGWGN
jgi:hypothetical protein